MSVIDIDVFNNWINRDSFVYVENREAFVELCFKERHVAIDQRTFGARARDNVALARSISARIFEAPCHCIIES